MFAHASWSGHVITVSFALAVMAGFLRLDSQRSAKNGQRVAFTLGFVVVALAVSPPVETLAERTFTGHMVQHLLLLALAPPLLVVAHPLRMLASPRRRPRLSRVHRMLPRLGRTLPLVAWGSTIVVLFALHLSRLYDAALDQSVIHMATHAALVGCGVLTWHSVLRAGSADGAMRVGLAIGTGVPVAVLGIVLTTASHPLSQRYSERLGVDRALSDQRAGGAIMWITAMLVGLALTVTATLRWASHEQRVAERAESFGDRRDSPVQGHRQPTRRR